MRSTLTFLVAMMTVTVFFSSSSAEDIRRVYREAEQLSNQEKLSRVRREVGAMREVLQQAMKALRGAHERKDITQINCVKDRLSTIKGLLRISTEAGMSLDEALVDNQADLVNHEYVKVMMASDRIGIAQLQLMGCTGDMTDPLGTTNTQLREPEVSDDGVKSFTAPSDAEASLPFTVISNERPEALSASK